jgi:signal transduction histidine kinase
MPTLHDVPRRKRSLHISVIALLAVSVVQVCWWFVDQERFFGNIRQQIELLYLNDATAAEMLAERGVPHGTIAALFPHVTWRDSHAAVAPESQAEVEELHRKRMIQYAAESGFFLLVLGSCIFILLRGLRDEAAIRRNQDNFLALVSHQFKTPLASLRLSAETMVMRDLAPQKVRELSNRMLDDLRRMESMVTKILDSARVDSGRISLHPAPVSLAQAVRQVVTNLSDLAKQAQATIDIDIPADLEVEADPLALDTVLRNILENAIAATAPAGGGTIAFHGKQHAGHAILTIADTGIGFPPEHARDLLQKFARLETPGPRDATGTGLGLYIVARLMHFGGGRVHASSPGPGKGATFTLEWPLARSEER